ADPARKRRRLDMAGLLGRGGRRARLTALQATSRVPVVRLPGSQPIIDAAAPADHAQRMKNV
ncbi:hypothetical protein AB0B13_39290, partial [Streptomyces sp. NPDC042898]|uniref:hypothetical protein n=1 Tax=Streptomyces sp. NPDC042898 TaxID=3154334 RepID=UPI0033F46E83